MTRYIQARVALGLVRHVALSVSRDRRDEWHRRGYFIVGYRDFSKMSSPRSAVRRVMVSDNTHIN
jgi:hypothetical protein